MYCRRRQKRDAARGSVRRRRRDRESAMGAPARRARKTPRVSRRRRRRSDATVDRSVEVEHRFGAGGWVARRKTTPWFRDGRQRATRNCVALSPRRTRNVSRPPRWRFACATMQHVVFSPSKRTPTWRQGEASSAAAGRSRGGGGLAGDASGGTLRSGRFHSFRTRGAGPRRGRSRERRATTKGHRAGPPPPPPSPTTPT